MKSEKSKTDMDFLEFFLVHILTPVIISVLVTATMIGKYHRYNLPVLANIAEMVKDYKTVTLSRGELNFSNASDNV